MTKRNSLYRRLFVLAFLLGALFFFSHLDGQPRTVYAAACCQDCDGGYAACLDVCNQFQTSSEQSACATQCNQSNMQCVRHCVYCENPASDWECGYASWYTPTGGYCQQGHCFGAVDFFFETGGCYQ